MESKTIGQKIIDTLNGPFGDTLNYEGLAEAIGHSEDEVRKEMAEMIEWGMIDEYSDQTFDARVSNCRG